IYPNAGIIIIVHVVIRDDGINREEQLYPTRAAACDRTRAWATRVRVLADAVPANLVVADYVVQPAAVKCPLSVLRQAGPLDGCIVATTDSVPSSTALSLGRGVVGTAVSVIVWTDRIVLI